MVLSGLIFERRKKKVLTKGSARLSTLLLNLLCCPITYSTPATASMGLATLSLRILKSKIAQCSLSSVLLDCVGTIYLFIYLFIGAVVACLGSLWVLRFPHTYHKRALVCLKQTASL